MEDKIQLIRKSPDPRKDIREFLINVENVLIQTQDEVCIDSDIQSDRDIGYKIDEIIQNLSELSYLITESIKKDPRNYIYTQK
jgi:hypothetical protein